MPVEALGRTLAFREPESGDEAVAPSVEDEEVGDGVGDRNGSDGDDGGVGDMDGTTSGDGIDSKRVNTALLAGESQLERQSRRTRDSDLPVSSWPPIQPERCLYGDVRRQRGRGRIKVEPIKVSQSQKCETPYLECVRGTQPLGYPSKHTYRVYRHRHQRRRIRIGPVNVKIERINDKPAQDDEMTHLGRACTTQPHGNPSKGFWEVHRPRRQCGHIKIEPARLKIEHLNDKKQQNGEITYLGRTEIAQPPANDAKRLNKAIGPGTRRDRMKIEPVKVKIKRINVNQTLKVEKTYLGHANTTQPPTNVPKHLRRVHTPRRHRRRIKFVPTNVSQTDEIEKTYLGRAHMIQFIRRPKKGTRRLDKLTVESRMPGQLWRDVEDHG